jgi:predicted DNA-binding transcriptional regulator YafY
LSIYFKRHTGFRKADESLCADDGAERERETEHTLGVEPKDFRIVLRARGEIETTREKVQDLKLDEGGLGFQDLTEEEIPADVVKVSAMEDGSDNELDEPQESAINMKLLSSTRDNIGAVINYVGSSTNRERQAYYEHLRTARETVIKEQQPRSIQAKLYSFLKHTLLRL